MHFVELFVWEFGSLTVPYCGEDTFNSLTSLEHSNIPHWYVRDSDPRHATISSSTGPPRSSVLGHSLSPLRRIGTGCRIASAPSSRSTPSKPHCLTVRDWILTAAETMRQSSTVWLPRALVTSSSCYGALEIVWILLLLLLLKLVDSSNRHRQNMFLY